MAERIKDALLAPIRRLRFVTSGWARSDLDPTYLCPRCVHAWEYGRWFPRWCKGCATIREEEAE